MIEFLSNNRIIAAVKDQKNLEKACLSPVKVVFLLFGSISDLPEKTSLLKKQGKIVYIHVDLIDGLKPDRQGIAYVAKAVRPHGIISTKPSTIKLAAELGLKGVLRIFMIDASAYNTGIHGILSCSPDLVEIMPGLLTEVVAELKNEVSVPIVAGGMIKTKTQAANALHSGAIAISTSSNKLWDETFS